MSYSNNVTQMANAKALMNFTRPLGVCWAGFVTGLSDLLQVYHEFFCKRSWVQELIEGLSSLFLRQGTSRLLPIGGPSLCSACLIKF
jgi:hypothetical protein